MKEAEMSTTREKFETKPIQALVRLRSSLSALAMQRIVTWLKRKDSMHSLETINVVLVLNIKRIALCT